MQRRVKLDFKPLSLDETAQTLGVPRTRARKKLAMVGVDLDGRPAGTPRQKRKSRGATNHEERRNPLDVHGAHAL